MHSILFSFIQSATASFSMPYALTHFATKPLVAEPYIPNSVLQAAFCTLMFILGAIFGSFLCCQARRLRRKEKHQKSLGSRSVCLHCKHQLKWYENLPIISWCLQGGKCRHCGHSIGSAELLSELLTAIVLTLVATTIHAPTASPAAWLIFAATVIFTLLLIFLAIYDGLYGELPTLLLTFSIICAIIISVLRIWALFSTSPLGLSWSLVADPLDLLNLDPTANLFSPLVAALLLGGLYLLLYLVSHGRWVGDGDWLLAGAIGLALGTPFAALIALFVANFSACLVAAPSALKRKRHQIYFGPFLVAAFVITLAFCGIIDL